MKLYTPSRVRAPVSPRLWTPLSCPFECIWQCCVWVDLPFPLISSLSPLCPPLFSGFKGNWSQSPNKGGVSHYFICTLFFPAFSLHCVRACVCVCDQPVCLLCFHMDFNQCLWTFPHHELPTRDTSRLLPSDVVWFGLTDKRTRRWKQRSRFGVVTLAVHVKVQPSLSLSVSVVEPVDLPHYLSVFQPVCPFSCQITTHTHKYEL